MEQHIKPHALPPEYVSQHYSLGISDTDVPHQILSIQTYAPNVTGFWSPHVIMMAFSAPTWAIATHASLKKVIAKVINAQSMHGIGFPTRVHSSRPNWDIWSESRSLWILVGEDGLYHLITHNEDGNHLEWELFPSLCSGIAKGSHKALCLVLGQEVSNRLALETQKRLSLGYPDI